MAEDQEVITKLLFQFSNTFSDATSSGDIDVDESRRRTLREKPTCVSLLPNRLLISTHCYALNL